MPYILKPQEGENILLDIRYEPSAKSSAFHFAVTDQALYLPATKFAIAGDASYFKRVPNGEIKEVSLQKINPIAAWVFAVFSILAALILIVSQILAGGEAVSVRFFGLSAALLLAGVLLPLTARGRKRLVVVMAKSVFRWNPPFVVDKHSKQQVADVLQSIIDTCKTSGLSTSGTL